MFATIAAGAAEADASHRDLSADMVLLATSGILRRLYAEADPADHVGLLRRIGAASLPVGRLAGLAHGAPLFVTDAACRVEAPGAGEEEAALSLAARETVETACLEAMALADRALGARSFVTGNPIDLLRRDLGFFLRQADLDGKLRRVGRTLCESRKPIGAIWSD
ncbi:hypothetical protein J7376_13355 [Paracoccus sp. R12_1]|uniref:hypothetical protein n=1 Tax=unclassified Paracoccus (in: a-proteobacteria) TaxID=2688777 RepID=UPI001ADCDD5F|nr:MULTISPECIES: hypothetical protein [unclassified Paracoccus (in: a-proteobacteria)]MBO9456194.1 hypothetical protein [Paracoccus sp. R12_2]MBO9487513.1 hypothetical protein [Paracoccus sp. R12_1]